MRLERRKLAIGILIGLLLAYAISLLSPVPGSMVLEGDFPAFYANAQIVLQGRGFELYDLQVQQEIQNQFWPAPNRGFHLAGYPPYVAVLLTPLGLLSHTLSHALFIILSIAALIGCLAIIKRLRPSIQLSTTELLAFALLCPPIFCAVLGGQLTIFLALAFCLALLLLKNRQDLSAGFATSVLFIKPQFALPYLLFGLAARRWRFSAGLMGGGAICFLLGAALQGWSWPEFYLQRVQEYAELNLATNGGNMLSVPQTLLLTMRYLVPSLSAGWVLLLASAISILAYAFLFRSFLRLKCADEANNREALVRCMTLSLPLVVLAAPQALFYELSFALLMLILLAERPERFISIKFFAFMAIIGMTILARTSLPFPIFLWFGVAIWIWTLQGARELDFPARR